MHFIILLHNMLFNNVSITYFFWIDQNNIIHNKKFTLKKFNKCDFVNRNIPIFYVLTFLYEGLNVKSQKYFTKKKIIRKKTKYSEEEIHVILENNNTLKYGLKKKEKQKWFVEK